MITIIGTFDDDRIIGNNTDETIIGGAGSDVIVGRGGDDILYGDEAEGVLIANETFADGVSGWTYVNGTAVSSNEAMNDGNAFMGRFAGNSNGAQQVRKTYTLDASKDYAVIEFDFLKIDSWDAGYGAGAGAAESFTVYTDGAAVFSFLPEGARTHPNEADSGFGTIGNISWEVTSSGQDAEMGFRNLDGEWEERAYHVRLVIDNPDPTITLGIGAKLNQAIDDESFGIDNVSVVSTDVPVGGNDVLNGGSGDDILDGNTGNDILVGGAGADVLIGGEGTDRAAYWDASEGVFVNMNYTLSNTGDAKGDTYSSIEDIQGSSFNDILIANNEDNGVFGGAGNDKIYGAGGNDIMIGSTGDDAVYGNSGSDWIDAGTGIDYLVGGEGEDKFVLKGVDLGFNTVADFTSGEDKIFVYADTGIDDFSELQASLSDHASGSALITFADGGRTLLVGVDQSDLSAMDFAFI